MSGQKPKIYRLNWIINLLFILKLKIALLLLKLSWPIKKMKKHVSIQEDISNILSFIVFQQNKIFVQSKSLQPTRQVTNRLMEQDHKLIHLITRKFQHMHANSPSSCEVFNVSHLIGLKTASHYISCPMFSVYYLSLRSEDIYRACPFIVTRPWIQVNYNIWLFISDKTSVSNAHLDVWHCSLPLQVVEWMGNSLREQSTSHLIHKDHS